MPSYYDLPIMGTPGVDNFTVEDANKYAKLPFYLVMNEVKKFVPYKTWDALYGKIKWQANMGNIMRGVRPEHSPISNSFVYPRSLQNAPNKNVFETLESSESAYIKAHRFESKQFHFLPSFQDFRDNQLSFNHDDIIRQIAVFGEQYLRGNIFYRSPNIMIAGNQGTDATLGTDDLVTGCPTNDLPEGDAAGGVTIPGNGKVAGWLTNCAAVVGQSLTLKVVGKACNILDDDLGGLPFEGTLNTPRENDLIKGKYALICGTEAWRQFTWDDSVANLKAVSLDLLFDGFKGSLFGMVTAKPEKFPLRMNKLGVFVAPQIIDMATNKTRPNPAYSSMDEVNGAPYEWAFLCAADAWKSITVGPPPKEFAGKSMSAEKFYSLNWSGEVRLTDQVLIKYADGSIDLNRYGTQLQFISQAVFGALAGEVNNVLPILFRRRRIVTV